MGRTCEQRRGAVQAAAIRLLFRGFKGLDGLAVWHNDWPVAGNMLVNALPQQSTRQSTAKICAEPPPTFSGLNLESLIRRRYVTPPAQTPGRWSWKCQHRPRGERSWRWQYLPACCIVTQQFPGKKGGPISHTPI